MMQYYKNNGGSISASSDNNLFYFNLPTMSRIIPQSIGHLLFACRYYITITRFELVPSTPPSTTISSSNPQPTISVTISLTYVSLQQFPYPFKLNVEHNPPRDLLSCSKEFVAKDFRGASARDQLLHWLGLTCLVPPQCLPPS